MKRLSLLLLLCLSCSPVEQPTSQTEVSASPDTIPSTSVVPSESASPLQSPESSASPSAVQSSPSPVTTPAPSLEPTPLPTATATSEPTPEPTPEPTAEPVAFAQVKSIVQNHCIRCHSQSPTNGQTFASGGVEFDSPQQIKNQAQRIQTRVVDFNSMPPGGGVSDAEKLLLTQWFDGGATIE